MALLGLLGLAFSPCLPDLPGVLIGFLSLLGLADALVPLSACLVAAAASLAEVGDVACYGRACNSYYLPSALLPGRCLAAASPASQDTC